MELTQIVGSWFLIDNKNGYQDQYEVRHHEWIDNSLTPRQAEPHVEFNQTYIRFEWSDGTIKYFPLATLKSFEWRPEIVA